MSIDIKNFYHNTPLKTFEYSRLKLDSFPEDIINQYKKNYTQLSRGKIKKAYLGYLRQYY